MIMVIGDIFRIKDDARHVPERLSDDAMTLITGAWWWVRVAVQLNVEQLLPRNVAQCADQWSLQ